jgi:hypothetical protein
VAQRVSSVRPDVSLNITFEAPRPLPISFAVKAAYRQAKPGAIDTARHGTGHVGGTSHLPEETYTRWRSHLCQGDSTRRPRLFQKQRAIRRKSINVVSEVSVFFLQVKTQASSSPSEKTYVYSSLSLSLSPSSTSIHTPMLNQRYQGIVALCTNRSVRPRKIMNPKT